MATEQTNTAEATAQAAAEEAKVVAQAMAAARTNSEIKQNAVPKISGPIMKQPIFNWLGMKA